jgi:NADPH:quinone reductase
MPCDITRPVPRAHRILVKVAAAGVNRADLLQARGQYPPPPGAPLTLGMAIAGEVMAAGGHVGKIVLTV